LQTGLVRLHPSSDYGAPWIHGELLKFGIDVRLTTVGDRHPKAGGRSRNHAACDDSCVALDALVPSSTSGDGDASVARGINVSASPAITPAIAAPRSGRLPPERRYAHKVTGSLFAHPISPGKIVAVG
jgi:hypothetical protein